MEFVDKILNIINEPCNDNNEQCKLQLFRKLDAEVANMNCGTFGCSYYSHMDLNVSHEFKKFYSYIYNNSYKVDEYNDNVCACFIAWINKKKNDLTNVDMVLWEKDMTTLFNYIKSTSPGSPHDNFCKLNYAQSECKLSKKLQRTSLDIEALHTEIHALIPRNLTTSFISMKYVFTFCFLLFITVLFTFIFLMNFGKIQKFLYNKCNMKFLIWKYTKNTHPYGNYDEFPRSSENERFNIHYLSENNF
ncbi:variable surface protein [Plasmodium gonderi]|uniref:Variable surface protein n=1 Tax=Plasmodium gonderi TaxID=77519 RepID=A0A1Y1JSC1_PLAGO|nr:variable surface protein [Plasmodium gonderi]GAW84365.1 variable surface protein [Plasmodium gonderi]